MPQQAIHLSGTLPQSKWKQIFILSLPRSGSTLLRMILDTHPEICCPGELSLGQLCVDLHHSLYFSIGQASANEKAEREAIVTARVREIIDGFMKFLRRAETEITVGRKDARQYRACRHFVQDFPTGCLYMPAPQSIGYDPVWMGVVAIRQTQI